MKNKTITPFKLKEMADKPTKKELLSLLKECRDLLVMCTLIDKSGQCNDLVNKIDSKIKF